MFLDQNGLICQSNLDGGDTAQRMGFWYSGIEFRKRLGFAPIPIEGLASFETMLQLLVTPLGLIRNPIHYDNPNDVQFGTSRDQTRPMIISCGLRGAVPYVEQISPKGILGRYPNGDIASPENWNETRRALGKKPLLLGDFWSTGATITRIIQAKSDQDDVGDDLNTILTLTYFYLEQMTRVSRINLAYYIGSRPANYGVTKAALNGWFPESDPVLGAISWYNRPENVYRPPGEAGGNKEMVELFRPILARLRSDLILPV